MSQAKKSAENSTDDENNSVGTHSEGTRSDGTQTNSEAEGEPQHEASDGNNSGENSTEEKNLPEVIENPKNVTPVSDAKIEVPTRPKRGMPKAMLANQQKYMAIKEKEMKLKGNKGTKTPNANLSQKPTSSESGPNRSDGVATRRIVVGGKVKYIPVAVEAESPISVNPTKSVSPVSVGQTTTTPKPNSPQSVPTATNPKERLNQEITTKLINELSLTEKSNGQTQSLSQSPSQSQSLSQPPSQSQRPLSRAPAEKTATVRIPDRYAKEIEKNVKKNTVKNVKNFSELRKVRALENLDTTVDTNTASLIEIRKLKVEQRKRELIEAKERVDSGKKESPLQQILNNDKMSQFSKTVAIKNLSASSRTKPKSAQRTQSAQVASGPEIISI